MEKKSLFTLLIIQLCCLFYSNAQTHEKVVATLIETKEYDKAIDKVDSLINQNLEDSERARLWQLKADALYYLNDLDQSLDAYLTAVEIALRNETTLAGLLLESNSHVGYCLIELGRHNEAINYYNKALNYALLLNDSLEMATQYFGLSSIFNRLGAYESSLEYLNLAYEIDKARNDTASLGFDLRNLADLCMEQGDYKKALSYSLRSLSFLPRGKGNVNTYDKGMAKIGQVYMKIGQYDSSRQYLTQSLEGFEEKGDSLNMADRWVDLAELSFAQNQPNEALQWATKAKTFYSLRQEGKQVVDVNLVILKIHFLRNNLDLAESILKETQRLCMDLNLLNELMICMEMKANLYDQTGRYREAFMAYQQFHVLNDSLLGIASRTALMRMDAQYQVDFMKSENDILKLENELATQVLKAKQQQVLWLIIAVILVISGSITISLILISRHSIRKQLLETEISELRKQIKGVLEGNTESFELSTEVLNKELVDPLSDREFEILNLALGNKSNSEIADSVFVSVNTVKFHLKNIYSKLGVVNRKEALSFALKATSK